MDPNATPAAEVPAETPEGVPPEAPGEAPEGEAPEGGAPEGGAPEGGAPEAPTEVVDPNLDLAKKFNQVTESEKKLRLEEEALKAERQEFSSKQEALANLKTNPLKALGALGISFKDLAEQVLNDEEPTTEQKLKTLEEQVLEDKRSRDEQSAKDKELWEAAEEAEKHEAAVTTMEESKVTIKHLVDNGEGKYELIQSEKAYDLVWDTIQEVFNETNKVISFEDAADKVEDYLTKEVERFLGYGKFKRRFQEVPEEPEAEEMESLGHNHYMQKLLDEKYGRTLTSEMTSDGTKSPAKKAPYLSDDESKYRLGQKLKKRLEAMADV